MAQIKIVGPYNRQATTEAEDEIAEKVMLQAIHDFPGAVYAKIEYAGRWQLYNVDADNRVTLGVNSTITAEIISDLERQTR